MRRESAKHCTKYVNEPEALAEGCAINFTFKWMDYLHDSFDNVFGTQLN